jgi:dUTP pyrophosphatase
MRYRCPYRPPFPPTSAAHSMHDIIFEPLHADVAPPQRATASSAGYDLRAFFAAPTVDVWSGARSSSRELEGDAPHLTLVLAPGERAIVPLGFRATLPEGIEAQVRARSGTALKLGLILANGPGTIDPDYTGEWGVLVLNASSEPVRVAHGERIAQLVLARFEVLVFSLGTVVQTTERAGGFGSTGTR